MNDILTEKNFLLFCAKHYDNPVSDSEEFFEDLNRLKYVKKLITRYIDNGELKERLILNHIIILNNCFYLIFLHPWKFGQLRPREPFGNLALECGEC